MGPLQPLGDSKGSPQRENRAHNSIGPVTGGKGPMHMIGDQSPLGPDRATSSTTYRDLHMIPYMKPQPMDLSIGTEAPRLTSCQMLPRWSLQMLPRWPP